MPIKFTDGINVGDKLILALNRFQYLDLEFLLQTWEMDTTILRESLKQVNSLV